MSKIECDTVFLYLLLWFAQTFQLLNQSQCGLLFLEGVLSKLLAFLKLIYPTEQSLICFMQGDGKKGVRIFMASESKTHTLCNMLGVCLQIWAKFKIFCSLNLVMAVVKDVLENDLRVVYLCEEWLLTAFILFLHIVLLIWHQKDTYFFLLYIFSD